VPVTRGGCPPPVSKIAPARWQTPRGATAQYNALEKMGGSCDRMRRFSGGPVAVDAVSVI
jgi:hypothetical protein